MARRFAGDLRRINERSFGRDQPAPGKSGYPRAAALQARWWVAALQPACLDSDLHEIDPIGARIGALRQLRYTDPAAAMPQLEVLVAEVRAGDQADLLAQACVELGICALHAGERLRAKDLLIEGMDAAERAENLRAWLTAANALSWMHPQAGEPVSAVVVLMRAVERAQVDGSPRQVAVAASNLGACLLNQGALSEALACYERAATLLEHAVGTQRRSRGLARVGQINALVLLGRLDEASALLTEWLPDLIETPRLPLAPVFATQARVLMARGDIDQALSAIADGLHHCPEGSLFSEVELRLLEGEALFAAGRPADAITALRHPLFDNPDAMRERTTWQRLTLLARAAREAGQQEAELFALRALASTADDPRSRQVGAALHALARRIVQAESPSNDPELAAANEALAQKNRMLHERARALVEARDAALQTAEVRHRFLSVMSHELRTPLGGVVASAETLMAMDLDPEAHRIVEVISEAADLTIRVIDDVLEHGRLEAGSVELDPRVFPLRQVLQTVVDLLQPRARATGVEIELDVAADAPESVHGDDHRLQQVLLNLVGNAVKFAPGGLVRLVVRAERSQLAFEVVDDGPGIPKEALPTLFRPWTQGSRSVARHQGGSGLGLAISRRLVEAMGGHLTVESEEGSGTTFRFGISLPQAVPSGGVVRARNGVLPRLQPPLSVLLVEDHPVNQQVVVALLEQLGVAVQVATDGETALQLARGGDFDLLLLDRHLPDIDGTEIASILRASEDPRPRIALTAAVLPEDRAACLEAGMDDFLPKPVTRATLASTLRRWLPTVRARRGNGGSQAG